MSSQLPRPSLSTRQEYAANLVLEDSRLRGSLTDDQFQPLLDWALTWTDAYAAATVGLADDWKPRVDVGVAWVKAQIRALVTLLESWPERPPSDRRGDLAALAPTFPAPRLAAASARLADLRDAGEAAGAIAKALPAGPR
ncbi:MAG TPA: hypothetical protein VG370_20115 [Chloroflexota bacterium]|nr:hypothetical protein [Chloroflexota bacterium]